MMKVDKSRILSSMSGVLSTRIGGCRDGGMKTRIWLSRHYQKKRMECKGVVVLFLIGDANDTTQVSLCVLPIGGLTTLFPTESAACPAGVARKPGRDIRADPEGHQKAEPRICSSTIAMSRSGCSSTSSRGTCGSPCI